MVLGLIGAGLGLLGGAADRRAQKKANNANRPVNQVREWEEAGINPLFGISSGGYIPHQASQIGDTFSRAGNTFLSALKMDHSEQIEKTRVENENQDLKKKLDEVAKPNQPSHLDVYGGILPLPSQGGLNASTKSAGSNVPVDASSDVPFGHTGGIIASGRDVQVNPYTSGSGFTEISNDLLGTMIVPGEDGEPWGIDEVLTAAVSIPANLSYRGGKAFGEFVDRKRASAKMREIYKDVREQKRLSKLDASEWGRSPRRSISPTQKEIDDFNYRRNVKRGY